MLLDRVLCFIAWIKIKLAKQEDKYNSFVDIWQILHMLPNYFLLWLLFLYNLGWSFLFPLIPYAKGPNVIWCKFICFLYTKLQGNDSCNSILLHSGLNTVWNLRVLEHWLAKLSTNQNAQYSQATLQRCRLGLTLWNLSCLEFKFDDTRLSYWHKNKIGRIEIFFVASWLC